MYQRNGSCVEVISVQHSMIVLIQRNHEPHKGKWGLPGGFVEYGEHPKEAACREFEEETGTRLQPEYLKFLDFIMEEVDGDHRQIAIYGYKGDVRGYFNTEPSSEILRVELFRFDDLPLAVVPDFHKKMFLAGRFFG